MNILTVPVRVDAFVSNEVESVVSTADDFDNLPYVNSQHFDINFDVANIASSIARKPLNSYSQLPAGIHLHWSMPDVLTEGKVGDNDIDMPVVPNRWLIRRVEKADATKVKSWIVESDYLYPDGVIPERAIAIPGLKTTRSNDSDEQQPRENGPNWQYLGRQLPLEQWLAESDAMKRSHNYLTDLNVLGWGTPYFSSLYTDCYSVFGFFDTDLAATATAAADNSNEDALDYASEAAKYEYQVFGWYSKTENDFVTGIVDKLRAGGDDVEQLKESVDWMRDSQNPEQPSDETIVNWVEAQLALEEKGESYVLPERMVCCGKVRFADAIELNDEVAEDQTELTFARAPSEAMAAWLSKQQQVQEEGGSVSTAVKLENQILALLYNSEVEGQGIDFVDRLKGARHQSEFQAVSGGVLWEMLDDASITEDIIQAEHKNLVQAQWQTWKGHVRNQLIQLNKLQERKNKADDRVDYQRRMLYNDWSKYMLSLHPVDLEGDYYPDIDMLRLLMTQKSIPALESALTQVATLQELITNKVAQLNSDFVAWKNTEFADLSEPSDWPNDGQIEPSPPIALAQKLPDVLLQETPAPRYWQLQDPCLLIAGNVAQTSLRHGADGALPCHFVTTDADTVLDWVQATAAQNSWYWHKHAVNDWHKQPWSPLMVEWSMNLYPDENASQPIEANQFKYNADFITSNYRIPLNDEHFGLPSAGIDLLRDRNDALKIASQPAVINGRSLLTDSIRNTMYSRIKRFLDTADTADASDTTKKMVERITQIASKVEHADYTILSLEGLYDELLMYSSLSLMDVDDPFQFAARKGDKHITDKVAQLLEGYDFKLPAVGHRFTPIKSGIQKLGVLQLVDTFGRFKAIETSQLNRPHRPMIGGAIYSPPRLLQPTRLSFRWLDNMAAEQATPIQGWLGYNLFDETIVLFDETGEFIGHINSDGEWCNNQGFKQELSADMPEQLRELTLKLLSFHSDNRVKKHSAAVPQGLPAATWDLLIQQDALRPLSENKAQVMPLSDAQWQAVASQTSIALDSLKAQLVAARGTNNYWPALKQAVRRAIDNIEPEAAVEKGQPGTIKPLAIVKAQLDLQIQGGGETDKSWSALKLDLDKHRRSDRDYLKVQFPIKLGEYNNLDDGLVGYWQVSGASSLPADGYFPQSDMSDVEGFIDGANFDKSEGDFVDQIRGEGVANLTQSLEENPLTVLLLMDPDAAVHATTGIVPKKSLYLSPEYYRDVVGNIRSRYFMAPLLTQAQQTTLPLPEGEEWLWEMPTGETDESNNPIYIKQLNVDMLEKSAFIAAGATEENWAALVDAGVIREIDGQQGVGWLQAPDGELSSDLAQQLRELTPIIDSIAVPSILSVKDVTPLGGKVRVMEGWLSTQEG